LNHFKLNKNLVDTTNFKFFEEEKRKRKVRAESPGREFSTGNDSAERRRGQREADWSTESSGSSSSTKDGFVESGKGGSDRGRESGSKKVATVDDSGIPRKGSKVGDRKADWSMESSGSRPSTNDGFVESCKRSVESLEGVRASKNKMAAALLIA
jgi:hypothetical protein